MVSRLEKGIFDKLVNQVILKKRTVGAPFKYNSGSVDDLPK